MMETITFTVDSKISDRFRKKADDEGRPYSRIISELMKEYSEGKIKLW